MLARRNSFAAFTLVELILVLMVITIIIAIIAPSLSSFAVGRRNKDTATLIMTLSSYARTQAISEGRVYRLNIDTNANLLWLTAGNGGVFQRPVSDYGEQYLIPDDVRVLAQLPQRQDGTYIEFQPSGRSDPAKIRLTDRLGGMIEVDCDSPTELFHIVVANGAPN